jgi:hypothetical protein
MWRNIGVAATVAAFLAGTANLGYAQGSGGAVGGAGEFTLKLVHGDHSAAFREPSASEIQLEILRRVGAY